LHASAKQAERCVTKTLNLFFCDSRATLRYALFLHQQYRFARLEACLPRREQMKPLWGLILVLSTAAGCAGIGTTQSNQASDPSDTTKSNRRGNSSAFQTPAPPDAAPMFPSPPDSAPMFPSNTGAQPILPATGGPPVIGIPLGGDMYLPVTGGPPVVGIPLAP
jgi:hypothetical protein